MLDWFRSVLWGNPVEEGETDAHVREPKLRPPLPLSRTEDFPNGVVVEELHPHLSLRDGHAEETDLPEGLPFDRKLQWFGTRDQR